MKELRNEYRCHFISLEMNANGNRKSNNHLRTFISCLSYLVPVRVGVRVRVRVWVRVRVGNRIRFQIQLPDFPSPSLAGLGVIRLSRDLTYNWSLEVSRQKTLFMPLSCRPLEFGLRKLNYKVYIEIQ